MPRSQPKHIPNLHNLIERYNAGESAHRLGKEVGVKGETLVRHMLQHGVQIRGRSETQRLKAAHLVPEITSLVAAYAAGDSVLALSLRHGLTRRRVEQELRDAGVELRDQSSAETVRWQKIRAQGPDAVARQMAGAWASDTAPTEASVVQAARTREAHRTHVGKWEAEIAAALRDGGAQVTEQRAVYRYNVDIALDEASLAVEIVGTYRARTSKEHARLRKRTEHLLRRGWAVCYVDCTRGCDPDRLAKHLIALADLVRTQPAASRGYRVIRGDTQPASVACLDFDDLPVMKGPDASEE